MRLPVDVSGASFLAAGPARPVLVHETNEPKVDKATGQPVFTVPVIMILAEGTEVFDIKVAGKPPEMVAGQVLAVRELVALPWRMGDRSGVSFHAGGVRLGQQREASPPQLPVGAH